MQMVRRLAVAAVAASAWLPRCLAQEPVPEPVPEGPPKYTDPSTNITFGMWGVEEIVDPDAYGQGSYKFGMALPADALTKDATEYIGYLQCQSYNSSFAQNTTLAGWCAISHGEAGQMTHSLLIMAWPWKGQVMMDFRFATAWQMPGQYVGKPKITQISSFVNDTAFEVIYRCQNCFTWNDTASEVKVKSSSGMFILGRAQAAKAPETPGCPSRIRYSFHDYGYGQYGASLIGINHTSYTKWAALATKTVSTNCPRLPTATSNTTATRSSTRPSTPGATTATPTAKPTSTSVSAPATTSASSLPPAPTRPAPEPRAAAAACPNSIADGKTYDYIIVGAGAAGIPMADRLSEAGKSVLLIEKGPPSSGRWGGSMKPGWLRRTNLTRFDVPGLCNEIWHDSLGVACTDTDQMEGCVLGGGTAVNAGLWWKMNPKDWDYNFPAGWHSTDMKAATDRVFERIPGTTTPSMDGKLYRQEGFDVLAKGLNSSGWTYLDKPNDHPDQKNRVYGHTTFMYSFGERGGPLSTYLVSAAQRAKFTLWMETAVRRAVRQAGHVTGVELECTNNGQPAIINVTETSGRVIFAAGTFASAKLLLRSGIGPGDQLGVIQRSADGSTLISNSSWIDLPVGYNLNDHVNTDTEISHPDVVFYDFYAAWDKPIASDEDAYLDNRTGILAQAAPNIGPMFWEEIKGSDGIVRQLQWTSRVEGSTNNSMIMSQYLGRGSQSRGRMTITPQLNTRVALPPYLHNDLDKEAVIRGLENLQQALKNVPNLTWITPPPNMTATQYVNSLPNTPGPRRANHWIGTAKMGTDDGRTGGTSVVDLNTKVYGTDNLFVIDASIFPGHVTGNPSAGIVTAAERASEKILALRAPVIVRAGQQCGGNTWAGSMTCQAGLECQYVSADLSRCEKPSNSVGPLTPPPSGASPARPKRHFYWPIF